MIAEMQYFDFEDAESPKPKDGSIKLVLAWERLDQCFWTFAKYEGGRWTENQPSKKDLTDAVEYWCELPSPADMPPPLSEELEGSDKIAATFTDDDVRASIERAAELRKKANPEDLDDD